MIKKAINLGVCKINVNTECQLSFAAATRKYIEEGKDQQGKGFDPRKLLAPGFEAIKETVKGKNGAVWFRRQGITRRASMQKKPRFRCENGGFAVGFCAGALCVTVRPKRPW